MGNVGIYLLEIRGKKYIGSSINLRQRLNQHKSNLKCNRHANPIMQSYYNKYKELKVSVLKRFEYMDLYTLRKLEKYLLLKYKCEFNLHDPVTCAHQKEIFQFTKEGKLIKKFSGVLEASKEVGIGISTLRHAANPNEKETKTGKGFLWSYTKTPPKWIDKRRKDHVGIVKSGELSGTPAVKQVISSQAIQG